MQKIIYKILIYKNSVIDMKREKNENQYII